MAAAEDTQIAEPASVRRPRLNPEPPTEVHEPASIGQSTAQSPAAETSTTETSTTDVTTTEAPAAAAPGESTESGTPATATRIFTGELISFACAVTLLPIMFLLDWYGVVGLPIEARRSGITTAENAWTVLTNLRWLMLLTIIAAVGAVALHVSQRKHGAKTDTSIMVTVLGTLTALLVTYRVLIDLPNSSSVVDVKIGAYLGVLCTIGIAIGGYESIRQERERRGNVVQKSRLRRRRDARVESRPDAR
jgi:hypothetical protein